VNAPPADAPLDCWYLAAGSDEVTDELTSRRVLGRRVLLYRQSDGTVVALEDRLMDVAMGLMSCSPAFFALIVEALADAGVTHGMPAEHADRLVTEAMAGTAALLADQGHDTLALRRSVTSPGGATARGLRALEDRGARAALAAAVEAALEGPRR